MSEGFTQPIIVITNVVVSGHARLEACRRLGIKPKIERRKSDPLCKSWPNCSCIFQGRQSDCQRYDH